jgi:hypothetical protein
MCTEEPEYMRTGVWFRQLIHDSHRKGVEALYGEVGILDDDCFGEWMVDAWTPVHNLWEAMKDDYEMIPMSQYQEAGQALLDMMFRNTESCRFKKIGDDIKHWCHNQPGTCFKMEGWFDRIVENVFPLAWNAYDWFTLLKADDICATDQELIDNYAQMWGDYCRNTVIVHGMQPLTWNGGLELDHIKMSDYHKEKEAFKKNYECPVKKFFEGLVHMIFQ